MKKGDVIARVVEVKQGNSLATNFKSQEQAQSWINRNNSNGEVLQHTIDSVVTYVAVAKRTYTYEERAEVQWIVGEEVATKYKDGTYKVIDLKEEPNWKVVIESTPTYQSSVASMSDTELRDSIDNLRLKRVSLPKARRKTSSKVKKSEVEIFIEKLPKGEREKLMKKLGLVE